MNKIQQPENPFIAGQPAKGSDFFGREEILSQIETFLNQNDTISFFIKGQRRSGKTSFLKRSQEKFKSENNIIIYYNLQEKVSDDIKTITSDIQKKIERNIKTGHNEKFNSFSEFLLKIKKISNKKIILLIDELDVMCEKSQLNNNPENNFINFVAQTVKFSSENDIPLKMILATGGNYTQEKINFCNEIEKLGYTATLDHFKKETVDKLLDISVNLPFRENAKETLNEITSGNPFFTQALAYSVYDYAQNHKAQSITVKMVKKRLNSAVRSFGYGVAVIWNDLQDIDKLILYSLANLIEKETKPDQIALKNYIKQFYYHVSESIIDTALQRLLNNNFIEISNEKINFKTEFFRKWIVIDVNKPEIREIYKRLKADDFF